MVNEQPEYTDPPATWENVLVGKVKEVAGKALGAEDLAAEGTDQERAAHEVRVHRDSDDLP